MAQLLKSLDLQKNTIITGGIGSGVTSCGVQPILNTCLNPRDGEAWGGVILAHRGDLLPFTVQQLYEHKRIPAECLTVLTDYPLLVATLLDPTTGEEWQVSANATVQDAVHKTGPTKWGVLGELYREHFMPFTGENIAEKLDDTSRAQLGKRMTGDHKQTLLRYLQLLVVPVPDRTVFVGADKEQRLRPRMLQLARIEDVDNGVRLNLCPHNWDPLEIGEYLSDLLQLPEGAVRDFMQALMAGFAALLQMKGGMFTLVDLDQCINGKGVAKLLEILKVDEATLASADIKDGAYAAQLKRNRELAQDVEKWATFEQRDEVLEAWEAITELLAVPHLVERYCSESTVDIREACVKGKIFTTDFEDRAVGYTVQRALKLQYQHGVKQAYGVNKMPTFCIEDDAQNTVMTSDKAILLKSEQLKMINVVAIGSDSGLHYKAPVSGYYELFENALFFNNEDLATQSRAATTLTRLRRDSTLSKVYQEGWRRLLRMPRAVPCVMSAELRSLEPCEYLLVTPAGTEQAVYKLKFRPARYPVLVPSSYELWQTAVMEMALDRAIVQEGEEPLL
jgi:hypothetical protein